MPLIFGAQRFSLAGDMAIPPSDLTSGVSESMKWSNGELGLYSGGGSYDNGLESRARRALLTDDSELGSGPKASVEDDDKMMIVGLPPQLDPLLDQLLTFGLFFSVCCIVQLVGTLCWRYRCNRKYCAYRGFELAPLSHTVAQGAHVQISCSQTVRSA